MGDEMREVARFGWDAPDARRAMSAVASHASTETIRPTLAAVLLEAKDDGTARAIATDSYTLAVAELPDDFTEAGRWLIGRKGAVPKTGTSVSTLALKVNGTAGSWQSDKYETPFDLIDGQFPNWEQLMPDTGWGNMLAVGDLSDRLEAVRRMNGAVVLCLHDDGKVDLELNAEGWSCTASTSATWDGEPLRVGFSPLYLLRCLESCSSRNRYGAVPPVVEIRDGLKPALFTGAGVRALCMPVRLPAPIG